MIPRPFTVKSFADFLCGTEAKKASIVEKNKGDVAGGAVAYVDLARGTVHSGCVATDKIVGDISKGCQKLAKVWTLM